MAKGLKAVLAVLVIAIVSVVIYQFYNQSSNLQADLISGGATATNTGDDFELTQVTTKAYTTTNSGTGSIAYINVVLNDSDITYDGIMGAKFNVALGRISGSDYDLNDVVKKILPPVLYDEGRTTSVYSFYSLCADSIYANCGIDLSGADLQITNSSDIFLKYEILYLNPSSLLGVEANSQVGKDFEVGDVIISFPLVVNTDSQNKIAFAITDLSIENGEGADPVISSFSSDFGGDPNFLLPKDSAGYLMYDEYSFYVEESSPLPDEFCVDAKDILDLDPSDNISFLGTFFGAFDLNSFLQANISNPTEDQDLNVMLDRDLNCDPESGSIPSWGDYIDSFNQ